MGSGSAAGVETEVSDDDVAGRAPAALPSGHTATDVDDELDLAGGTDPPRRQRRHSDPGSAQAPRVGRFVVLARVGQGGIGRVYAAYDERLDRRVAVKVLRRNVGRTSAQRILREAQAMAKLSHPNVVPVFEVGEHDGNVFIAMEFIRGQTLDAWVRETKRSWSEVLDAYRQAGEGLAAAHAAGLIHRDFKPQNAMISARDDESESLRVRVLDFGLARRSDAVGSEDPPADPDGEELAGHSDEPRATLGKLTATGRVLGTPAYMAPEQFSGSAVAAAADQYSFCVALWEALYGERPFGGETVAEIVAATKRAQIQTPHDKTQVPSWLRAALLRGLSAEPTQRHPSMRALLDVLRAGTSSRRRGRLFAALGGGALIAAAGAFWLESPVEAPPCRGGADHIESVWGDAARLETRESFVATKLPYAESSFARTRQSLDEYAAGWARAHDEACAATTVRRELSEAVLDLRMSCLDRARRQLDAVSKVLGAADGGVVNHAHEMAASLMPLERCADIAALQADVTPPRPREAQAVEEIRTLLVQAHAEETAGRYSVAEKRAAQAREALSHVEYEWVAAELLLFEGSLFRELGRYEDSETALRGVIEHGGRLQQWPLVQRAASELVFVTGYLRHKPDAALAYRDFAMSLARGDPALEATVRTSVAMVLRRQGKPQQAEAELRLTLDASRGDQPVRTANVHNNLALTLSDQGDYAGAAREYEVTLEILSPVLDDAHPDVAMTRGNLATVRRAQGKYEEAESLARSALADLHAALGADHPEVARVHNILGTVLLERGDLEGAERETRRALEIRERSLGPTHVEVGRSRGNLAVMLSGQGRDAEAAQLLRSAIAALETDDGSRAREVPLARHNLARSLAALGETDEAEAQHRQALTSFADAVGSDHPQLGLLRLNFAEFLAGEQRHEESASEYRDALALLVDGMGEGHPHVASARTGLASSLLELGRPGDALEPAERGWAARSELPDSPDDDGWTAFVLARALWDVKGERRDRRRAAQLAATARDAFARAGPGARELAEEADAWLQSHRVTAPR